MSDIDKILNDAIARDEMVELLQSATTALMISSDAGGKWSLKWFNANYGDVAFASAMLQAEASFQIRKEDDDQ